MSGRRVLILPKWYPWPDRPVFGIFCREQARAAAVHNDVRVLAFTPEPMTGRAIHRHYTDPAEVPPTTRLVYRRPRLRPAAMATQLVGFRAVLRDFRRSGWRPEVIHAHVFEAGFPAVLLGRALGCPVVVSEHFTYFQRGLVRGLDLRLARYCFAHADLVCPVSEDLGRQLVRVAPEGRYRVVPNVVDTAVFRPPAVARSRREGEPLRLLNVASLDEKKRQADLLDAVARLRAAGTPAVLELVGDGRDRAALEARATALGVAGVTRFHGTLSPDGVAERMRAADVFVLPSRFENLPVVLLEAMATGLPVVASAVGGVPEIVDERAGSLVAPGDPEALAAAIAALAGRLASFDSGDLVERARARFSRDALAGTWDEIYEELIAARGPAGRPGRPSA